MTIRRKPATRKKTKRKPKSQRGQDGRLVRKLRADFKRRGIETGEAGRRAIAAATHLERYESDDE